MTDIAAQSDFWQPQFDIENRPDGTIYMRETSELASYLPSMPACLRHWAEVAPDRVWLAQRPQPAADWVRLGYGEAFERASRISHQFLSWQRDGQGLGPERPVMILSGNSIDHALVMLASQMAAVPGAAVSPGYSLLSDDHGKLRDLAGLLTPGVVYCDKLAAFAGAVRAVLEAVAAAGAPPPLVLASDPKADKLEAVALADWLSAPLDGPARAGIDASINGLGPQSIGKFMFTSGSTGSPKAVIITQEMMVSNQQMIRECFTFLQQQPPIVLDWCPWHHTAAGNKVFNMVLFNGGSFYIDEGKPSGAKIGETIANLKEISPHYYFNVPVGWEMLVEAMEKDADLCRSMLSNLKIMMYAGAAMPQPVWDRLQEIARQTTGHDVLLASGLGSTETAPFALMCTTRSKASGNIGVPVRGLQLKLVPNQGKLEARLKGPSITPGYWLAEAATKDSFDEEGFYRMGDALRPVDPDDLTVGFFFDGRVAENFKLQTGTWVAVGALRAQLVNQFGGLLQDVVIVGENKPWLGALGLLSLQEVAAQFPQLAGASLAEAAEHPGLRDRLAELLAHHGKAASGSSNRVMALSLLRSPPVLDSGELTDKGSVNQRAVIANRPEEVAKIYQDAADIRAAG